MFSFLDVFFDVALDLLHFVVRDHWKASLFIVLSSVFMIAVILLLARM